MIALLIAAGVAFTITLLGTPVLVRILRARGIGQLIRDDGPFTHPHAAKAGTPTMGGIAIVGATTLGYIVAHVRSEQLKFARTGVSLLALIIALAIVGFIDDYLGVKRRRNLGLRKRGKTGGQLLAAAGFALLALNWINVSTPGRRRSRSPRSRSSRSGCSATSPCTTSNPRRRSTSRSSPPR